MAENKDAKEPPTADGSPVVKPLISISQDTENDDGAGADESESTAHFEPVVHLKEVEIKTLEEEEETLYKERAKLFVYGESLLNKGTGEKTWNERGIGEIKFLKHRVEHKIRVLMRQEKTMKIIANHVADPRIVLMPNAGSDRSWVWTAFDFTDGELVETFFAIRFGNSDQAKLFKSKFEQIKEEMRVLLTGEDAKGAENDTAANEATDGIEALKIVKDEKSAENDEEKET